MAQTDNVNTNTVENPYPRLLGWEVTNFMSISQGKVEYDDTNIINFKGYNDSGKSAMLTALKVLLCNANPTKQVGFIQDGKDYFRVVANFEGGIIILRDKYANGQSLYEMYKNGQLLFTTKNGNTLTKVAEVPKPIEDFLGLINYDGVCLNSRSCFEKQIGVQTTGSENYKMFNTVLKSEEIASASNLINNDKNKLVADISAITSQIDANKSLIGTGANITTDMITYLKEHDNLADLGELKEQGLAGIVGVKSNLDVIPNVPQIESVDNTQLSLLVNIESLVAQLDNIKVLPEMQTLDSARLDTLLSIQEAMRGISSVKIPPKVQQISSTQYDYLNQISIMLNNLTNIDNLIKNGDERLKILDTELTKLQEELKTFGVKTVKCPDCGCIFSEEGHTHNEV